MMRRAVIIILLIAFYHLSAADVGCMYGWKLSRDGERCEINCNNDIQEDNKTTWNTYCQSAPLDNELITYNATANTLVTTKGRNLAASESQLPSCYNVTLRKDQYNVTKDGVLQIGNYNFPPTSNFVGDATFCYPLSPQLLQCETEQTPKNEYHIDNGVTIVIPSKNITAYLGDFYITDNHAALTCSQGVMRTLYEAPRCHYALMYSDQYVINIDGSMHIYKADFTINNPTYSVVMEPLTSVCFPLTLEFLNCPQNYTKTINYLYNRDMSATDFNALIAIRPDEYFVDNSNYLIYCKKNPKRKSHLISLLIYFYLGICVLASAIILVTIITMLMKFNTLVANNHMLCMLFHIIFLFIVYLQFMITRLYNTTGSRLKCYSLFSFDYFCNTAMMTWLNVVVFDLWQNFTRLTVSAKQRCKVKFMTLDKDTKFQLTIFCIYGFGVALILTIITVAIDLDPKLCITTFGICPHIGQSCWFNNVDAYIVFFAVPYTIMTMLNLVFLVLTIRAIRRAGILTEGVNPQWKNQMTTVTVKLLVLSGFCYIVILVCFIIDAINTTYFMYSALIYEGIMILQGIAIFVIYYKNYLLEFIFRKIHT